MAVAVADDDALDDGGAGREADDVDTGVVAVERGEEERATVAAGVGVGEERVGGEEGAPGVVDGAEAAEVLGWEAEQDVAKKVRWELAGGGDGGGGSRFGSTLGRRRGWRWQ